MSPVSECLEEWAAAEWKIVCSSSGFKVFKGFRFIGDKASY